MKQIRITLVSILVCGFLLGNFKGYLALWSEEDPEPVQIFPQPIDMLPEADQIALEEGIYARSQIELDQILESYLS